MSNYGENYRGLGGPSICPLCQSHCDSQKWSFQCKTITQNIKIEGNYSNIFSDCISEHTVQTIVKIDKFRRDYLQERMLK